MIGSHSDRYTYQGYKAKIVVESGVFYCEYINEEGLVMVGSGHSYTEALFSFRHVVDNHLDNDLSGGYWDGELDYAAA